MVHVPVKPEPCRTSGAPIAPTLHAEVCGDKVCLTPDDAVAIWEYVRENERRWERAQVCLDTARALPVNPDPLDLASVLDVYRRQFPDLDFTVHWKQCGSPNAGYVFDTHEVYICSEVLPWGASVVRFLLAHELAHAVLNQYDVPYTGLQETAADELASLMLMSINHAPDILKTADKLDELPAANDPTDPHPEHKARAYQMRKLVAGSVPGAPKVWRDDFIRTVRAWLRILEAQ